MIRFLLRFLGLLLLALAFIFVIYDGMKSIADKTFYATALSQFWTEIHASSLQAAQASIERLSGTLWILRDLADLRSGRRHLSRCSALC